MMLNINLEADDKKRKSQMVQNYKQPFLQHHARRLSVIIVSFAPLTFQKMSI